MAFERDTGHGIAFDRGYRLNSYASLEPGVIAEPVRLPRWVGAGFGPHAGLTSLPPTVKARGGRAQATTGQEAVPDQSDEMPDSRCQLPPNQAAEHLFAHLAPLRERRIDAVPEVVAREHLRLDDQIEGHRWLRRDWSGWDT
jgi:hypothetical protein